MDTTDIAVAIYDTHSHAEDAVKTLQRAGFEMKKISIIGRDYLTEEHVIGYFNASDRAMFFGKLGAFWGGLAGILFGAAFICVPVVGHVIILGPFGGRHRRRLARRSASTPIAADAAASNQTAQV